MYQLRRPPTQVRRPGPTGRPDGRLSRAQAPPAVSSAWSIPSRGCRAPVLARSAPSWLLVGVVAGPGCIARPSCPGGDPLAGCAVLGAHPRRARQRRVRGGAEPALRPRARLHLPARRRPLAAGLDRVPAAGGRRGDRLQVQLTHPAPSAFLETLHASCGVPGPRTRSPWCRRRARCRAAIDPGAAYFCLLVAAMLGARWPGRIVAWRGWAWSRWWRRPRA